MTRNESDAGSEIAASGDPTSREAEPGVLAKRVKWLFEHQSKPNGKRYSYRDVCREAARAGIDISPGYLSRLVNGLAENPTMEVLTALAKVFDVPFSYFDPTESTEEQQAAKELAEALKGTGVERIALRSKDLTPASLKLILGMVDRVREMEGLPPADESPSSTSE